MQRIYVLPQFIDWLIENDTQIQYFVFRLNEIGLFLSNQKKPWDCKIIIDFHKIEVFEELGLYDVRMFSSLLLDGNPFFRSPILPQNYEKYSYYVVPNIAGNLNDETFENIHIELADNNKKDSRVLNCEPANQTLLKIHKFDSTFSPTLYTNKYIDLRNVEIDLFLQTYVFPLFDNINEFLKFRKTYLSFYWEFDWTNWIPISNPAPGHNILKLLTPFYKKTNNDSDHLYWGYIMAAINGGKFNKELTQLNSKKKVVNDVFQLGILKGNSTVFYSIDTEQGNLEIYNYRGKHINKVYGLFAGLQTQVRNYTIDVPSSRWH